LHGPLLGVRVQSENNFDLSDFVGDGGGGFIEVGEDSVEGRTQFSHDLLVSFDLVVEPPTKVPVGVPPKLDQINNDAVVPPSVFARGFIVKTLLVLGETLLLPLLDRGNADVPALDALALRYELCGDGRGPTGCQSLAVFLAINHDHLKIVDLLFCLVNPLLKALDLGIELTDLATSLLVGGFIGHVVTTILFFKHVVHGDRSKTIQRVNISMRDADYIALLERDCSGNDRHR
jgi:hypothetical protein